MIRPSVIAHRGFAGAFPENTRAAAAAAADRGADAVEVDVMPCADGTPVVFHDDRLDARDGNRGVTDGRGLVWETSCEAVLSARVLDTAETVPTLPAVLSAIPADVAVNVELKNPGSAAVRPEEALDRRALAAGRERWDPFVDRVIGDLAGAPHELLVSSFCEAAIASTRDLAPDLDVGVLIGDATRAGVGIARRYEAEALHPSLASLGVTAAVAAGGHGGGGSSTGGVPDLLDAAADLGCAVNAWTVRTWHEAERLAAAGVDGVIADYPGLLDSPHAR